MAVSCKSILYTTLSQQTGFKFHLGFNTVFIQNYCTVHKVCSMGEVRICFLEKKLHVVHNRSESKVDTVITRNEQLGEFDTVITRNEQLDEFDTVITRNEQLDEFDTVITKNEQLDEFDTVITKMNN